MAFDFKKVPKLTFFKLFHQFFKVEPSSGHHEVDTAADLPLEEVPCCPVVVLGM